MPRKNVPIMYRRDAAHVVMMMMIVMAYLKTSNKGCKVKG